MPQNGIRVPVGELDLGNKARLNPVHPFARDAFWQGHRRVDTCERFKPVAQIDKPRCVEVGADAARMAFWMSASFSS